MHEKQTITMFGTRIATSSISNSPSRLGWRTEPTQETMEIEMRTVTSMTTWKLASNEDTDLRLKILVPDEWVNFHQTHAFPRFGFDFESKRSFVLETDHSVGSTLRLTTVWSLARSRWLLTIRSQSEIISWAPLLWTYPNTNRAHLCLLLKVKEHGTLWTLAARLGASHIISQSEIIFIHQSHAPPDLPSTRDAGVEIVRTAFIFKKPTVPPTHSQVGEFWRRCWVQHRPSPGEGDKMPRPKNIYVVSAPPKPAWSPEYCNLVGSETVDDEE